MLSLRLMNRLKFASFAFALMLMSVLAPFAGAQSFTANFASDQGPFLRRGQGYLYSWWHGRESPMHGNLELKPNSWRIGYWGTWDYEYQPMADQGVDHIQVILTDAFRNRGSATVGGFSHDYTWQSKSYVQVVEDTVHLVNARNWTNVAFDLINEPDAFGIDGISDWYRDAWVPAFRKIRELRPQAQIVGPGFFSANLSHLTSFLSKAKADNVVPDILSQHLLDNQNRNVVENYTAQMRALLAQYGLADRPISFNEYINPGHISFVEDVVDALAQAERANVQSMMHSSWDDSGELPPWNSTGDAACFDGVLSIPGQRERACYWVYKFYGDMNGRRVASTGSSSGSSWDGIVTLDTNATVARVLLGGNGTSGSLTLNLNSLPAAFGSSVDVRIERVTSNGNDLTAAPTLHSQQTVAVSGGNAAVSISGIPARSATMVTIRPSALPAQVAKPAFSPLRGSYWKPTTVTLSTGTGGATIRYTLDGTMPTATSPVYSGPIHVTATTTLRVMATAAGMRDSEIAEGTFTIRKPDNGLYGEFFANTTLSGTPAHTRIDRTIGQDYGGNRWDATLPSDGFSARWTGRLRAGVGGTYQIHTVSDDGVRLYLDNVLQIDNWTSHARTTNTVSLPLNAGQDYDVRLEYYDNVGDSICVLQWTPPGGALATIPTQRLFPPTSPTGANLLVGMGTSWNFLAPTTAGGAPTADWKDPGFNDASWSNGVARIGWGGDGEITVLTGNPLTTYYRKTFNVANTNALAAMLDLAVVRDDGAIVYVNGTEVLRDNMPTGAVNWATVALGSVGNGNETTPARGQVPRSLLVAGLNTIAVEIHQRNASDSDGGFDCALSNPSTNTPPVIGPIAGRPAIHGLRIAPVGFSVTDGELFASLISASATSSNPTLIPTNTFEFGGYGRSRTLTFVPATNQTGSAVITVTISDGQATASTNFTVTVSAPPANTAPTIGNVTDKSIVANAMSDEFYFTVGDAQTDPGLLTVTGTSSNPSLIANSNIFFNGTAGWRTVSVRPTFGQDGTATITLTVSDGLLTATDTFLVSVQPAPTLLLYDFNSGGLQGWTDLTVFNQNSGPRFWTNSPPGFPGNAQEGAASMGQHLVNGGQDNAHPTLRLRSPEFVLNGEGDLTCYLSGGRGSGTLAPLAVASLPANSSSTGFQGVALRNVTTAQYVLSAARSGDGGDWERITFTEAQLGALDQNARYTFDLIDQRNGGWGWTAMDTVTIPGSLDVTNTAPTVTALDDLAILTNSSTGPLAFTIGDAETPVGSLQVSATSTDTTLVPFANIALGGSGANRTMTVTPVAGQMGRTTITLAVSDGSRTVREAFVLVVTNRPLFIARGFTWNYLAPVSAAGAPAAAWTSNGFTTTGWSSGPARIGYGGDGEVTVVATNSGRPFTVYFRRAFTVTNPGDYSGLQLALSRDDGAVVYLNGLEKWRANMPATGAISYTNRSTTTVGGADETNFFARGVNVTGLVAGVNILAVEVHQSDTNSSDLGFDLEVAPLIGNTPPEISAIADRQVAPGVGTGAIGFSINDAQTPANSLQLTKTSSNPTLVPEANIVFAGSGENRTVTVTPAAGQAGTATITITVSDGALSTNETFVLSVPIVPRGATWDWLAPTNASGAPPANWNTIGFTPAGWSNGPARVGYGGDGEATVVPSTPVKPFTLYLRRTFNIADPAQVNGMRLLLSRDDGAVIYLNGVEKWRANMPATGAITYTTPASATVGGADETNYFTRDITAFELVAGVNVIAAEVHQFDATSSDLGFNLELTPLTDNLPPTISAIADRSIILGASTGPIGFTVGDLGTPAASLVVTAVSSDQAILPNANIVLSGSGANRTLNATPIAAGSATVSVTVSDGSLQAVEPFALTVIYVAPGVLAEDHFLSGGTPTLGEYAAANLTGQNPLVAGWSSAWTKPAYSNGDPLGHPTGLLYPGLQTAGGRGGVGDGTRGGRVLNTAYTAVTVGRVYLSVLLQLESDDAAKYRCFELHTGGYDDVANRKLQLGQFSGNFGTSGYGLRVNNNSNLVADLGVAGAAVNLFVLRFDFATAANGDAITIWRNPTNLGAATEPPDGITLAGFDFTFDRLSVAHWVSAFGSPGLNFDEFRLGTNWASVTPPGGDSDTRLVFDFDDGTYQGWTQVMTNADYSPQAFVVAAGADAQSPFFALKQQLADTWPGFADLAHQTLWIRSPQFRLTGNGDLGFWIFGGGTNSIATPPANESQVPANTVDTANGGWHGVALRDAATGSFVLTAHRTTSATDWQYVRMSAAQLAALDTNAVYTLDVIDARNNSWGWFNFDSARIPGVLVLPPGPTLTIQTWPGNQLRISWPASAVGYRVQVKLALADAWEDGEASWGFIPVTEGSESVIYAPDWENAQFFRLFHP